jgi:hypothetical protein
MSLFHALVGFMCHIISLWSLPLKDQSHGHVCVYSYYINVYLLSLMKGKVTIMHYIVSMAAFEK